MVLFFIHVHLSSISCLAIKGIRIVIPRGIISRRVDKSLLTCPKHNHLVNVWDRFSKHNELVIYVISWKNPLDKRLQALFCGARQWCCRIPGCFATAGWCCQRWRCQPSMEGGIGRRATTTFRTFGGQVQGGLYEMGQFTFDGWIRKGVIYLIVNIGSTWGRTNMSKNLRIDLSGVGKHRRLDRCGQACMCFFVELEWWIGREAK